MFADRSIGRLSVLSSPSHAIDLTGAWATDQAVCEIRGKAIKCAIKARREEGETVHLRAACASDLLLSDVQFSVKIIDENRINRIFSGMEGIEQGYDRCRL